MNVFGHTQSQDHKQTLLLLVSLLGSAAVGVILATMGEAGFMVAFALVGIVGGMLAFLRPMLFLYVAIIVAASVSAFREVAVPIGKTTMTLSGLLWLMIAMLILLYLLFHAKRVHVPGYLWPFIAFAGWAGIRWLLTPTGFLGLKDLLWYSMPVLFGLFVPVALGRNEPAMLRNVRSIEMVFLGSVFIPIVLFVLALGTGLAEMTSRGPRGELIGSARGIPLYLLVVLAIALANWRYGPLKVRGRLFSLLALGTIMFTLGRMSSFLGLMLLSLSRINPRRKWQFLGAGIVVAVITLFAITHIPILQQRFFFTEDWDPSMGLKGINTAGRMNNWPIVFAAALQSPWVGHGLGRAQLLVGAIVSTQRGEDISTYYPHNEYVNVFHDLGLIGLIGIMISWGYILFALWKRWENHQTVLVRKWSMISSLCVLSVMISAVTDNTFHYPTVIVPTFIAMGIVFSVKD